MTGAGEDSARDEESGIMVVPDEFGALVIGDRELIDAFVAEWAEHSEAEAIEAPATSVSDTTGRVASAILGRIPPTTRYVRGREVWERVERPKPGTVVTFHKMTRSSKTGKILANPQVAMAAAPGIGPVLLALAVIDVTLERHAARIEARLDVIEDKVDDVLRLASAQRLGDVHGHRRILKRRVEELAAGSVLTDTDWSSIAQLGADLEVGVERLRHHATALISQLDPDASADKRADQLKSVVNRGLLGETLNLLLIAQQSLYLWQRLRLERIRSAEPEHLEQSLRSARSTLNEHITEDHELARELRELLDSHTALRISEVHRPLAGRTLAKYRAPLAETVDAFIAARALQIDSWTEVQNATVRDALAAARTKTVAATNSSRRQLSAGVGAVARWVEPKDVAPAVAADDSQRPHESNSADEEDK